MLGLTLLAQLLPQARVLPQLVLPVVLLQVG
jgi:hypothetical protein